MRDAVNLALEGLQIRLIPRLYRDHAVCQRPGLVAGLRGDDPLDEELERVRGLVCGAADCVDRMTLLACVDYNE